MADPLPVVFRVYRGELVAVFPTVQAVHGSAQVLCYSHVGQHGSAHPDILKPGRDRRAARPEEFAELLAEVSAIYEGFGDPVPLKVFGKAEGLAAPFFQQAA